MKKKKYPSHWPRLAFEYTPIFNVGANVTFRAGRNWFEKFHTEEKSDVVILGEGGTIISKGKIEDVYCLPFSEIKDEWMCYLTRTETGSITKTHAELLDVLRSIYDDEFCADDYVSVVFFTLE